jgi:catechol 2,3-dioxygenase-like lactoylglutathione lyase family enzyme
MKRTIAFYGGVLGMPLVENIELPDGTGHHFVFEIGNGALLAFFWFDNGSNGTPRAAQRTRVRGKTNRHDSTDADPLVCHLAFDVPPEKIDDYLERLQAKGVAATIVNYDDPENQYSGSVTEDTIGRSIYFTDPDGVVLEFATHSPAVVGRLQVVSNGSQARGSSPKYPPVSPFHQDQEDLI